MTLPVLLQEHRTLEGMNRTSSVLVDGSAIGTDPLFYSAGVLTPESSDDPWPPTARMQTGSKRSAVAYAGRRRQLLMDD